MGTAFDLWKLCQKFIEDNNINCPEAICQCDRVITNAYDFIEAVCDVVGYQPVPEEGE